MAEDSLSAFCGTTLFFFTSFVERLSFPSTTSNAMFSCFASLLLNLFALKLLVKFYDSFVLRLSVKSVSASKQWFTSRLAILNLNSILRLNLTKRSLLRQNFDSYSFVNLLSFFGMLAAKSAASLLRDGLTLTTLD